MKRRGSGSKQKGAGFERTVCVELSKWLTHGKRKDLFWRSAMSGGRATISARKGDVLKAQGGDISAIDPLGAKLTDLFYFELKFYKDLDIAQSILRGYGQLLKFWQETLREAKKHHKEPILIAKQNGFPTLVLVRLAGLEILSAEGAVRAETWGVDCAHIMQFADLLKEPPCVH